jgi:hypothetical protein
MKGVAEGHAIMNELAVWKLNVNLVDENTIAACRELRSIKF